MDGSSGNTKVAFAIAQDGALFPTAFPELAANLRVLFGEVVTGVVFGPVLCQRFFAPLSR